MKKSVLGIADSDAQAERIVDSLNGLGLPLSDVSVLLPDQQGTRDFAHEHNTKAPEGAIAGVGAGGVIGGTLGLLAGVGALAIPGLGPFIAAGPLMAALSGAAAGAAVGGLSGALIGLGLPEIEAKRYEGKLRGGNILIAVHVEHDGDVAKVKDVFERAGAHDVTTTGESSLPRQEKQVRR
jgi:hypothetical protein